MTVRSGRNCPLVHDSTFREGLSPRSVFPRSGRACPRLKHVDFCRREKARVVIRGVRVYSDFEYEFQMALTNRRMAPEIETLFMMPSENLAYVTASTVREIASYHGDTAPFVSSAVQKRLKKHCRA